MALWRKMVKLRVVGSYFFLGFAKRAKEIKSEKSEKESRERKETVRASQI